MTDLNTDNNKPVIHKGLKGLKVNESKISEIVQETSTLTYRGYAVQDLCAHCRFEEVAYLMWNGELPDEKQLGAFEAKERASRKLDDNVVNLLKSMDKEAHPMDVLRTAISYIGANDADWADETPAGERAKSLNMMAKIPTIIAAWMRIREGEEPVAPRQDLSFSENFFHMVHGKTAEPEITEAFDKTMILYAEHSFNVSTFTARTITSSLSDIYSAVTGAIGSLKGRLHGGANEAVMQMIDDIAEPKNADAWMRKALSQRDENGKKIPVMGFGHAVYKNGDSRVPTLKKAFNAVAKIRDVRKTKAIADIVENIMVNEKGIKPNVDYPTGLLYNAMGIPRDIFTPLFAMARITGWTAHVMEQRAENALNRPLCEYTGQAPRKVVPLAKRKPQPAIKKAKTKPAMEP